MNAPLKVSVVFGIIHLLIGCGGTSDRTIVSSADGTSNTDQTTTIDSSPTDTTNSDPVVDTTQDEDDSSTLAFANQTYITSVSDSHNDGHIPEWTLDESLEDESRWSAKPTNGDDPWIEFKLSDPILLSQVDIAFFRGDLRQTSFQILTSLNGENWETAYSGQSSGTDTELESFKFAPQATSMVRIVGGGNTESNWTSILEVSLPNVSKSDITIPDSISNPDDVVLDAPDTSDETDVTDPDIPTPTVELPPVSDTPVSLMLVQASNDDGHLAEWTIDSDLNDESRWSALPVDYIYPSITYELSDAIALDSIDIAFFRGDTRTTSFDVFTYNDVTDWSLVYSGESSGSTAELETFPLTSSVATKVKIVGYNNSDSKWTSIKEVSIPNVDTTDYAIPTLAGDSSDTTPPPEPEPEPVTPPPVADLPEDPDIPADVPATGDVTVSNATELASALSNAVGGEIILLKDGNYGSLKIKKEYADYIILRAENLHKAVFSGIEINGSNKGYVQFDRIASAGIRAVYGAHHLKYTNSKFSSQVYFRYANNIEVRNNSIDVDGGLHAMLVNSVNTFTIKENYITHAQEDLMRITGNSYDGLVKNNVFYDTLPKNKSNCAYNHTDGLQFFGLDGKNPRRIDLIGNYFYDDPSNNAIRPPECVSGKQNVRLHMQGIFLAGPQGNGFQDMVIEDNMVYVGSPNAIFVHGASSNVMVRHNTLLTWASGKGGSIILRDGKIKNSGLTLYGNITSALSDQTTRSAGMSIGENFEYNRDNPSSSIYKNYIFQGAGEGSRWQHFLPVVGSPIDFGSGMGALDRLSELKSGEKVIPMPQ